MAEGGHGGVSLKIEGRSGELAQQPLEHPGDELVRPQGGGVGLDNGTVGGGDAEIFERRERLACGLAFAHLTVTGLRAHDVHFSAELRDFLLQLPDDCGGQVEQILRQEGMHAREASPIAWDIVRLNQIPEEAESLELKGCDIRS